MGSFARLEPQRQQHEDDQQRVVQGSAHRVEGHPVALEGEAAHVQHDRELARDHQREREDARADQASAPAQEAATDAQGRATFQVPPEAEVRATATVDGELLEVSVAVTVSVSFSQVERIAGWLKQPAGSLLPRFVFFSPTEPFGAYLTQR